MHPARAPARVAARGLALTLPVTTVESFLFREDQMAEQIDTAPTTSYSDPIYDRLERAAQSVRRRWYLVALFLVLCLAGGLVLRWWQSRNPEAASAVAFVRARGEEATKRDEALRKVATAEATTPAFRARAWQEVAQIALLDGKIDAARDAIAKAKDEAAKTKSDELILAVRLSQGAVAEDAGQLDEAFTHYDDVRSHGQKFPAQYVPAVLGVGRVLAAQHKPAEAMTALEDVMSRTDDGVEGLVSLARSLYWRCKREAEGAPVTVPKVEAVKTVSAAVDGAIPAPAPADAAPAPTPAPAVAEPKVQISSPPATDSAPAAPAPAPAPTK